MNECATKAVRRPSAEGAMFRVQCVERVEQQQGRVELRFQLGDYERGDGSERHGLRLRVSAEAASRYSLGCWYYLQLHLAGD